MDHFIGSIFLLVVVFMESIMLNLDFGWKRLEFALRKATYGNPGTPDGRTLFPKIMCRLDLHFFVPVITGLLAFYLMVTDAMEAYGDYPTPLLAMGWSCLAILSAMIPTTLWKKQAGTLKPFTTEDIRFSEPEPKNVGDEGVTSPSIQMTHQLSDGV